MGGTEGRRRGRVLRRLGMVVAGIGAMLGGELAWVVHRDLPSFEGSDASGRYVPEWPASAERPILLVALGDSTLTGPGLDDRRDLWLWQALDAVAPPHAVEVRSLAVGGSRVADVRQGLGATLAQRPDLAVLAVGSNDAIHGTPRRAFGRDLAAVITELSATVPVIAVANVGDLSSLERVPAPLSWLLRVRSRTVCAEIERIVSRHPAAVLLDVAASGPDFHRGGVFVGDRFHPNAIGHGFWGRCAEPGLRTALERATVARR